MRKPRGFPTRILAAAMLIWLGLVITDPLTLDACPMHGSHASHGTAHASHSSHAAPSSHGGAPKKASRQCTCIGDCCLGGSSFATLPPKVLAAAEPEITAFVAHPHSTPVVRRSGVGDHTHPPANAPPTIS